MGRFRRPWSLRTRLVVSAVVLLAVVGAVIGTVTVLAMGANLQNQLDAQLKGALVPGRMGGGHDAPGPGSPSGSATAPTSGRIDFVVSRPGQPLHAVAAGPGAGGRLTGAQAVRPERQGEARSAALSAAQTRALSAVARDGRVHSVSVPGLGDYRAVWDREGGFVIGFPTDAVDSTVSTLLIVVICVTAAGLVAAVIAGTAIVGVALRPLRRVASTATRVSELPLHSGEVALYERVPGAEADARTEVGQVGAALNRMLDHVHEALSARQESETRVRQFVADASHELRTPLASIRGYAELTRRGREEVGPDTRHSLGRIESEAARMTGLVEDLLLLARLDAGRPLSYESTDLSSLVVDVVGDAHAAGQGHAWLLELPAEPVAVRGDRERLQQVFVNLLANARTHTPPGTTVTARVEPRGSWVLVEIDDTGPGIPAELLPHVFERFARGDASRSRNAGSTGLGLAIVQAVVAAHGGRVSVRSTPGRTVFTVLLPTAGTPDTTVTPDMALTSDTALTSNTTVARDTTVTTAPATPRGRLTGPAQPDHTGVTAALARVVVCEPTLLPRAPRPRRMR
ncbi:cell wall metabolism sensor histidine kinase WalK [Streptomyces sp. NBC_00083]|uniref:sensor histidine kinase n=1 Tax=Streptomyces sp. NBC_00083 TaxID=2975647 RepID=UPI00225BFF9B|nr:HAMP domain-containing sensor histidine kinase [Streptomyces sp. NBC_00083]MCX5387680.1 HAMP domain-containing histidine kinase [Streptomyces sp. NBC_00083]